MQTEINIRRSPIVVIRTLVLIELAAFVLYYLVAALGNHKYEFFLQLPLVPSLISYQALKFLVLSGAQFVITVYAFLSWYYESYLVTPRMISHYKGVFFKKSRNVPMRELSSVSSSASPLGKFLHYGSIYLHSNSSVISLVLPDISYPKKYLDLITEFLSNPHQVPGEHTHVTELLAQEEHEKLEFKSSLRFDQRSKQVNRELEKMAMKTVAAFLNSGGGHLVIGVDDSREPLGLEADYKTLGRQNSDGFESHFTQIFNAMIGPDLRHLVRLRFPTVQGREVAVVDVAPSAVPVYLRVDNTEHFYVRTGNISTPLKMSEAESYARARWPQQISVS
ncbi:MAG: hypothetical protein FJY98_02820 [Candidatus Liptonbacteria bacterium]|nr:hypothetical protein [Candidatus Liptonbacteria bacterium]